MLDFEWNLQRFAEDGADSTETPADTTDAPTDAGAQDGTQEPNGGTLLGGTNPGGTEDKAPQPDGKSEPPATYDFSSFVPEGMEYDAERAGEFGDIARECGLTQEQAGRIAQYGMQYMQQGQQAAVKAFADTVNGWAEDAKTQLGGQFNETMALASTGINAVEQKVPGLREMLNATGAGNRVEMIRLMAEVGRLVGEDRGHESAGAPTKSLYPNTDFSKY